VLSTVTRCLFVAKVEIADYPIFGEVGKWAGIVFIDRRYRDLEASEQRAP
jgi:1-acyl-sn-glycerol-3-phosphate acyltransferase